MMVAVMVDHGWSWLVCLGVGTVLVLETGLVKALGVLLPVLRQQFAAKTWIIGLMISLVPGIGAVVCPLAGALSKRFSARYTVMLFSLLSSMGLVLGSMSSSVVMLSICFVVVGFAFGAEAIMAGELARYFDKYFSTANAIARAGVSIGIIVMPLLTQFLIDVYGWRGTMLILGGLNLHCIVAGAILRPIDQRDTKWSLDFSNSDVTDAVNVSRTNNLTYNKDHEGENIVNRLIDNLSYYLDLNLFLDPVFLTRMVFSMGCGYCLTGWLIYLVPFAMEIGLSPYKAALLATFGGIGNLFSRVTYPLIVQVVSNEHILYCTTIANCLALALYPVFSISQTYIGFLLCSMVFGEGFGYGAMASYQIAKEHFESENVTNAFVWLFMAYSVGSVVSGFLSGWVFDQTGSYTVSFVLLSVTALLSVSPQPFVKSSRHRADGEEYSAVASNDTQCSGSALSTKE